MNKLKQLMGNIKTFCRNLITKIKTFYSTNRTKKLALSAVATTVVAGAVAIALLASPALSPIASNVSDGATVSKDAEKDKIAKDETKKDDAKKDETKDESKDETKDEVKDEANVDTGTPANEGTATPENKPSTASNNSKPADKPAHTHNWVANMVTIPGQAPQWKDTIIPGSTYEQGYYTWPDGCKVKATDYGGKGGSTAADAEHTAKHGQMEMGYTTETITIPGKVEHVLIKEEIPEHQEQHGWKCSCGATKD